MTRREFTFGIAMAMVSAALGMMMIRCSTKTCPFINTPLENATLHICTYRKSDNKFDEVHLYCDRVSPDLWQCFIYDNPRPKARLLGIEYMVSWKVHSGFDECEKLSWHSNEYEASVNTFLISGKDKYDETSLLREWRNMYCKTISAWRYDNKYPVGDPILGVSPSKGDSIDPKILQDRKYGKLTK